MNILISTTTGWNIGDEFIRMGVQHLLEESLGTGHTYIFYDRNPDYFVDYPGNWEMGTNHFSNRMNGPIKWDIINLVVLAGSPEFVHGPLKNIYEGLATRPHIPLWAIGVGYSNKQMAPLTPDERAVLSRDNTLIIARQKDLVDQLPNKVTVLPCPALYCIDKLQTYPSVSTRDTAVILSAPVGNQRISRKLYGKMLEIPGDKLVHYIDDFTFLAENKLSAFYDPEPYVFLNRLKQYEVVHTTRLHGGIAALSNHKTTHFYHDNHRMEAALELFKPIIGNGKASEIAEFKMDVKKQYLEVLDKYKTF